MPATKTAPPPRQYWLVKSEPDAFSWEDLWSSPSRTTGWDGVRNYKARNFMRDEMRVGDGVLFYHSSVEPPAVVGVAEVVRTAYPDETQFDPADPHYDPKSRREAPTWVAVDLRATAPLKRPVSLAELRETRGLEKMVLLQRGNRLSVMPVTREEFAIVCRLGGLSRAESGVGG
jgi:predicted RNA-binding protein with PUA-like domain